MDYRTAKVIIKDLLYNDEQFKDKPIYQELCNTLIEALDKQIEAEPIDWVDVEPVISPNTGLQEGTNEFVLFKCPICGEHIGYDDYLPNYCSECGQKIDTSVNKLWKE